MKSWIVVALALGVAGLTWTSVDAQEQQDARSCNCVVFRFDDIQDYWIPDGQEEPLKVFEDKKLPITLGIVTNSFGEDFEIVNATKAGVESGQFEPAIHGWNHVSYANLSLAEQTQTMGNATNLLMQVYGVKPDIFIPPFNDFDADTIEAMKTNQIPILSAEPDAGSVPGDGDNVYIAKKGADNITIADSGIFHLPQTVDFNHHIGGDVIKVELDEIIFEVNKAITTKGYAVVVLHPTDFVDSTESGKLDNDEINDLERLIDILQSEGRNIVSFKDVMDFPK